MTEAAKIRIRPATAHDDQAIARLLNTFIRETHVHFGTESQSAEAVASERGARDPCHPWLVAERDGAFAGFARAHGFRSREAYRHTAEVAVYVERGHQRLGVGCALYSELLTSLRHHAIHTCLAGIALPNDPSIRLHEAMGFERVGVCREVGHKFGAWHDVLFMQRMLG